MNPFESLRKDFLMNLKTKEDLRNIVNTIPGSLPDELRNVVASQEFDQGAAKMQLFESLLQQNGKVGMLALLKKLPWHLTVDGQSITLAERIEMYECEEMQRKRLEECHNLDENFVGRVKDIDIIEKRLFHEPVPHITGICIHGMAGVGKTTIVENICSRHHGFDQCFISMRDIKTFKDFLLRFYVKLGLTYHSQATGSEIEAALENWDKELIICLDSVELLINTTSSLSEALQFMTTLSRITEIRNHKVKVIMTSLMNPWSQHHVPNEIHIRIPAYKLDPLPLKECCDLLKKMAPKQASSLDSQTCTSIAQRCDFNPLVIRAVGTYLNNSRGNTNEIQQFVDRLIEEDCKTTCLISIIENLQKPKRDLLLQLSVFETWQFDIKAAMYVAGRESKSLMNFELHELCTQSLLEGIGSQSLASTGSEQNERFSLHLLVATSLKPLSLSQEQKETVKESEKRLMEYGGALLVKLGKLACKSSLEVTKRLADEKHYLMKYIEHTKKNKPALSDMSSQKQFIKHSYANVLMDWFLGPEKRAEYFLHCAKFGSENKPFTFCMMLLWYAEQYFEGSLFDPKMVRLVLKCIHLRLERLELNNSQTTDSRSVELCRAFYLYVQGRFFDKIGKLDEGIENVKKALKFHKKHLSWDLFIARDFNLLGHLYLKNGIPKKAVSYFENSCTVLQNIAAKNNKVDLHFDRPNYLMNTGCAFLQRGNEYYYEKLKCKSTDKHYNRLEQSMKDDYEKAVIYFDRALSDCDKLGMGSTMLYGQILKNKACTLAELEEPDEALRTLDKCLPLFKDMAGGEQRMQYHYMRGTIEKDLGKRELDNNTGDHERHYTDAKSDFEKAYELLKKEGHFQPRDDFIPKLSRDYVLTLEVLGMSDEASTIKKNLQDLIDRGSEQIKEIMSEKSVKQSKSTSKRKLSTASGTDVVVKKLRKQQSIELDDSELENPESIVGSSAAVTLGDETNEEEKPGIVNIVSTWIRRLSRSFSSQSFTELLPGQSDECDNMSVSSNESLDDTTVDDDLALDGIEDNSEYSDDSSNVSYSSAVLNQDERINEEYRSWDHHKDAVRKWLNSEIMSYQQ